MDDEPKYPPIYREDYKTLVPVYKIITPDIPSGNTYHFTSTSGIRYEVLFAKKKDSYLENIVNFSVLNEEFEDEYSETNRGEVFRVVATLTEIIRIYHLNHPASRSYEFSGEFKDNRGEREVSVRSLLYERKAREIMHESWDIKLDGNKVTVYRK